MDGARFCILIQGIQRKTAIIFNFLFDFGMKQAEINYLGQLRHPNLVKLIGFCLEDEHRLLVYEFMSRGSMENHLFRSKFHYLCPQHLLLKCVNSAFSNAENLVPRFYFVEQEEHTFSHSLGALG